MSFIAAALIGGTLAAGGAVGAAALSRGSKPKVPDFPNLNLDEIQRMSIAGNLQSIPEIQGLVSKTNTGNRAEVAKAIESAVPGATTRIQKNILDQLEGVADISDTQAALRNLTAANFNLGVGGKSQFSKFSIVGQLGRSVAQQKQQGLANFGNFFNLTDAPRMDISSMFFSPSQRVNAALGQQSGEFNVALARAGIDAQPSRAASAAAAGLGAVSNFGGLFTGAALAKALDRAPSSSFPSNFGPPPTGGSVGIPGRFNFQGSRFGSSGG